VEGEAAKAGSSTQLKKRAPALHRRFRFTQNFRKRSLQNREEKHCEQLNAKYYSSRVYKYTAIFSITPKKSNRVL